MCSTKLSAFEHMLIILLTEVVISVCAISTWNRGRETLSTLTREKLSANTKVTLFSRIIIQLFIFAIVTNTGPILEVWSNRRHRSVKSGAK